MRVNNRRYITRGVSDNVDLLLQLFVWQCIDELEDPKDYLQVFKCSMSNPKVKMAYVG